MEVKGEGASEGLILGGYIEFWWMNDYNELRRHDALEDAFGLHPSLHGKTLLLVGREAYGSVLPAQRLRV